MYSNLYSLISELRWTRGKAKIHDLAMHAVPIEFDTPNFIRCAENEKSSACNELVVEFVRVSLHLPSNEKALLALFSPDFAKLVDVFDAHYLARYDLYSNLDFEIAWENKFPDKPLEDLKVNLECNDNLQLMHRIIPNSNYFWGLIVHYYNRDLPILPSILADQIENEEDLSSLLKKADRAQRRRIRSGNADLVKIAEKLRAEKKKG
jgi:hypothetical protein